MLQILIVQFSWKKNFSVCKINYLDDLCNILLNKIFFIDIFKKFCDLAQCLRFGGGLCYKYTFTWLYFRAPSDMIYASPALQKLFDVRYDRFGDDHSTNTTTQQLRKIFSLIPQRKRVIFNPNLKIIQFINSYKL